MHFPVRRAIIYIISVTISGQAERKTKTGDEANEVYLYRKENGGSW